MSRRAKSHCPHDRWRKGMAMSAMRCASWAFGVVILTFTAATAGFTQEQEQSALRLQGTLKKVSTANVITLGYRQASFPLSYEYNGKPIGYSLDICKTIVEEIAREIDKADVRIEFALVFPETRIPALTSGQIDLECGSTTNNAERRKEVAFSPLIFITGTKLMVKRGAGIRSYRELTGKDIVVTANTTNEQVLKRINQ